MTETDPLKLLYRHLRAQVTPGVAGDVMQMPPSWGEILTAVHEAAFPDGDEPEPITVPQPVADVLREIAEQMAAGARVVVLADDDTNDDTTTVTSGIEADRALAAGVRARILAILDDLEAQDLTKAGQYEPRHEQWQKCAYAAHRLRQAKQLIIKGGKQ